MPKYDDGHEAEMMVLQGLATGTADGLIEAAEKQGQDDLVASEDLPRITTPHRDLIAKHTGIVFGEIVNDLFIAARLPEGWSKRATDHPMHSELVDDKGRLRAAIFYKADFYDRSADMHFKPFFLLGGDYAAHEVKIVNANGETVKDFGRVEIPGDSSHPKWRERLGEWNALRKTAVAWLTENYPDHADPFAYWD